MTPIKQALDSGTGLINAGRRLMTAITGDKGERERAEAIAALTKAQNAHQIHLAQAQANIEAAKHPSFFVAGARQSLFWICTAGMAWHFLVLSVVIGAAALLLGLSPDQLAEYREVLEVDSDELMTLALALLGLGGMRSYEKGKGVARDNMRAQT